MLKVKDADVYYGKTQVLRKISINIEQGEIVIILGANGAGKSTLLKTISGISHLKSGSIKFLNEDISNAEPSSIVSKGICHCPENRRIFKNMTVEKNLRIGAYVKRDKGLNNSNLKKMYELFPILLERKMQTAGSLSGGEQQMLAIARALMGQPKLLVLDEPSLGLSPKLVTEVGELVQKINNLGVTILLVEQNAKIALSVAHRGYVMERGEIAISGSCDELKSCKEVISAYFG